MQLLEMTDCRIRTKLCPDHVLLSRKCMQMHAVLTFASAPATWFITTPSEGNVSLRMKMFNLEASRYEEEI